MAKEIERKFLVTADDYRREAVAVKCIRQGYLNREPERTVRVRICDDRAYITVKTRNRGMSRNEWEYEIPVTDAREMLEEACVGLIVKRRYIVPVSPGLSWEVDEFEVPDVPVVAEIEIPDEDFQVDLPAWVGQEVTGDPRYYNSNISGGRV